ncbi:reverse transcriptase domain-containing protein [Tanacetum coccineum]
MPIECVIPLEFKVGDKVMLKVSPWKGVICFGKRGKLNPRYIGPFKIIAKVGTLAYRLELPEQLIRVHSTFCVSNLKKCFVDETLAIPLDEIQIDDTPPSIEEPVENYGSEIDPIVAPKVGTLSVVLPIRVLDLVDYLSSSNSDPSEDYLPPVPDLPLVSPFLCSGDSEIDGESRLLSREIERHESLTLSSEFPLVPVVAPPEIQSSLGSSSKRSLDSSSPSSGPSRKRRSLARGISDGVVAHPEDSVGIRVEIAASDVREDDEEFEAEASAADTREIVVDPLAIGDSSESSRGGIPDLEDTIYDIVHYMSELVASGERASWVERIGSLRIEYLKVRAMLSIERDRIDSLRWHMALSQEEFCQNGNGGNRGGDGNGGDGNGGNGNPNENNRGARSVARECTYQDFMKCQPLNFKGTKGVVGLIRWFEKMETIFHISNCLEKYQVKYATCTLLNSALTWWNSHKRTIGTEAAFAMSWRELMKLMAKVYCPRNEIQKMESELSNLTVKNNDLAAYTQRFQELTMMCTKMVPEEEDRVEKFIGGLPDNIQGNVIAAEPTKLQDAVRIANNLMDQKLKGYDVKNANKK